MAKLEKHGAGYDLSSRPIIHMIGMFFLTAILLYGLYVENMRVSELFLYCGLLYIFYEPIKKFAEENHRIQRGVAAADLSIADDPAFSKTPFIQAKSLKVGVELQPLIFSKKLNVTGVEIDGTQIDLIQSDTGTWNAGTARRRKRSVCLPTSQTRDISALTSRPTIRCQRFPCRLSTWKSTKPCQI